MRSDFFDLLIEEQIVLIRQVGDQLDMPDAMIEKDLWICWVLEKIFVLPVQMAFKGGTSLSKMFGLIKRFSEDCDITIDYRNFRSTLDFENLNHSQLKKISDELKEQLQIFVSSIVLPELQEQVSKRFPRKPFEITLSKNGEQLRFYYPSVIQQSNTYLRDHVFIEFGVRNSTEPYEKYQAIPYLAGLVTKDLNFPKPFINTLSPLRTFWEKATLIHVECHRNRMIKSPERLSRHWYDLFMLSKSKIISVQILSSFAILKDVITHKKAFFNASYAHYDDCLVGNCA